MTFRLTAFPCLAASMSVGIGRRVLNGPGSPMPCRAQMKALDANAPQPMAKLRRVRVMGCVPLVAPYRLALERPTRPWSLSGDKKRVIRPKADLEKLLKSEGHMPEDKFLVMSRKETSWGRVCEHPTR